MSDAHTVVWINGRRMESEAAHISARDRGLTLADGVFETMKARQGMVFRLDQHLARLDRALKALSIPQPGEIREWVEAAVQGALAPDCGVRLTVTRGIAPGGVPPPIDPQPTVIVTVGPLPVFQAQIYEHGLTAHVPSGRRNEFAMTAGLKTLAYTDAVAGLIQATNAGAEEALFLDTAGHCSEASASNLFAVIAGRLVTPPTSCAALPGITRSAVIELAADLGIAVDDRPFDTAELAGGAEAFLTSSLRGLVPLVRVDQRNIGAGRPGPVTRQLSTAYAALVDRECAV